MSKDRVHPLKLEDSETGGTEVDFAPTELDKNEDFVDAHGITIQNTTSNDSDVFISRDVTDNMIFKDKVTEREYTLTELIGGAVLDLVFESNGSVVTDSEGFAVVRG